MKRRLTSIVLAVLLASAGAVRSQPVERPVSSIGLQQLLATSELASVVRGIATFDDVPTQRDVSGLRALGLVVQPMKHLPLALVRGPVAAIRNAVLSRKANDVYPDQSNALLDKTSTDSMKTAAVRAKGYTGKGMTVAVVDSGCDATHPDIADHVAHNVKLISAEYVNLAPDSSNTIVVPSDQLPVSNSDPLSGHGTYVAGIIAADGTSDPAHLGVAPDAELVCLAIGEGIFTTAVVTAYDYLLDQPELWGVDVINNSWGNSFYMWDPRHPVHVATKAMTDQNVVVVFAAGNAGGSDAEMSLNLFSTAPWVIGVAAATVGRVKGEFSSNGLQFDNSRPLAIGPGGHRVFKKYRMGMYHPDVTAPGVNISSSCPSTGGAAVGPCPTYGNESASGTSAASPHVAGAAAILRQANPELTVEEVRHALQATAKPVFYEDEEGERTRLGFWQVGYGFIDLDAAVRLVTSREWRRAIAVRQLRADRAAMTSVGYAIPRSEMWTYDAPNLSVGGMDTRVFRAWVSRSATHLKVTVAHPSLYAVQENQMIYSVTVRDAAGKELGTTEEAAAGHGTASLLLDLRSLDDVTYGHFEFEVVGERAVSDPDNIDSESLLGRVVVVQVAQLTSLSKIQLL